MSIRIFTSLHSSTINLPLFWTKLETPILISAKSLLTLCLKYIFIWWEIIIQLSWHITLLVLLSKCIGFLNYYNKLTQIGWPQTTDVHSFFYSSEVSESKSKVFSVLVLVMGTLRENLFHNYFLASDGCWKSLNLLASCDITPVSAYIII